MFIISHSFCGPEVWIWFSLVFCKGSVMGLVRFLHWFISGEETTFRLLWIVGNTKLPAGYQIWGHLTAGQRENVSCSVFSDSLWPHGLYSPLGSSVHGVLQAKILEWVFFPFSRGSSRPRDGSKQGLLHCRQILYCLSHQGSSPVSQRLP